MNWLNIVIQLFSNPAIQELIREIEALFAQKTSTPAHGMMSAMPVNHDAALKQAVDEVVAKHVRKP
jgi:hypothetical protein